MAYVPCDAKGKEFSEKDDKFVENPDSLVGRDIDFKIKIVNARGLPNRFTVSILNYFPKIHNKCCLLSHLHMCFYSLYNANNMDPDQNNTKTQLSEVKMFASRYNETV